MADAFTFAFTDIEGSTARWERDRAAMQQAVRRHDAIVRAAIADRGGQVFKTIGDAFCSAFANPHDAVAAMVAVQQLLAAEDFSAVDGLRVRVAIHTGAADERDGDYFGPAVNRVARLLAIGHGGQILLTSETAAFVDGGLPSDVSLRDLGAYHLKDIAELQRVHQLLAPGLPSDFPPLRSLGTLPSDISIVDTAEFHPVSSFSGRDEELAGVHAALQNDGAIAMVQGLGGVGKSSIAREYGWRNRDAYSVVWWLGAQTEDALIDGLLRLGAMFVQGLDRLADRRAAAQRVINSILGGFDKPVLLVFDNLEDEQLLRTWLPRAGARALATSRNTAWAADVTAIPLRVWELATAVDYLQREAGRKDLSEVDASAIAQALGALPLAMAHAAAALRNLRMVSPQRYLERIKEHLKKAPRGAEYPHSVFATFSTAVTQAEQQAAGATAVLCFAASFAPDAIPGELFCQPLETYGQTHGVFADELLLNEALGVLDRLSLLTFAPSSQVYSMHRLVQFAARDLAGEAAPAWRECAVAVAESAFPKAVEFATWPHCQRVLPHAIGALEALPSRAESLSAAGLAHRCGIYLRRRGEYRAAEPLQMRALAIREKALGPNHPEVAASVSNLALLYQHQGRYAEAEPLDVRALAIRENAHGPDHPDVAASVNNLALVYRHQGRYAEAEPLYRRALAIFERANGPDHLTVAVGLTNLAGLYYKQGRYAEAEPFDARALAIRERVLGPDHPDVAASVNNLGSLYWNQGRYAEAEPLHLRALGIKEKTLGPDHPDVAAGLNELAALYCKQGRYAEAQPLHRRALAIYEKALGPLHPNVAETLNYLANLYRDQRRDAEAEPLYERALSILETIFGPDHPDIATSLSDRATLYRERGRNEEAAALEARARAIREKNAVRAKV
jgi:class 3 adenylate cyclase/tetratricopeptide (TPR) repeat protein